LCQFHLFQKAHLVEIELAPDSMIRVYKPPLETLPNLPASRLIEKNKFEYWICKHRFLKKSSWKLYLSDCSIRMVKQFFSIILIKTAKQWKISWKLKSIKWILFYKTDIFYFNNSHKILKYSYLSLRRKIFNFNFFGMNVKLKDNKKNSTKKLKIFLIKEVPKGQRLNLCANVFCVILCTFLSSLNCTSNKFS